MKFKGLIIISFLLIVGVFVWAKTSSNKDFVQAKDFPNGALVYLQVTDLPQVINIWNKSKLKENYLESQNFAEFQTSHLGIKLAERFADLSNSFGFSLDLPTVSGLAEKQAAVAIYDVGKLDIVFVAPMNETLFSATMFAQNSTKFTENELKDGTKFYLLEVEVDRKRQKQKVIFTNYKGRFILATNENLFVRTISAIIGKQRLYDENNFKKLSERITTNLATIWVNQEKLNDDYYFKRYWLMSDVEKLQNIRAGIFDLNFNESGLTEKREFLLKKSQNPTPLSQSEIKKLISKIPENIPFYRVQKVDEKQLGETIYSTLFDKQIVNKSVHNYANNWSYDEDYSYKIDYEYLNSDFDKDVNEVAEDEIIEPKLFNAEELSASIFSTDPTTILTATSPQILENPLFVEFRKIAIINLKNTDNFQANRFENSIIEALKNRVTVADTKFVWGSENGLRKLKVPMLGWEIVYSLKGDKLFISNSIDLLNACLETRREVEVSSERLSELVVIDLSNRVENFDEIMNKIEEADFFTGNISSLLDAINDVKTVRISRSYQNDYLQEEIRFY